MKLSLQTRVVHSPFTLRFERLFAWVFALLQSLCLGLAGCTPLPIDFRNHAIRATHLKQFTAAGHVLGFATGLFYVASSSHALKVEFVNANPVDPESDNTIEISRHSGMDRRNPDCREANNLRHPRNLGSGVPCRNDGDTLNSTALPVSYFPGGDGQSQQAPALTKVRYPGLWQGIDLAYQSNPYGIDESVWTVNPGADINQVRLRYNRPLALNPDGSLSIRYPTGVLTESAPIAWQNKEGQRVKVEVAFAVQAGSELGFTLGPHDPSLPVRIDPTLSWNTFLGGSGNDKGQGIAVDGSGNVYVVGYSYATWGSPKQAFGGGYADAFAAKLDSTGALSWNTFLGGAANDYGYAIAVDGNGNVYVAGYSDGTWGNPQQAFAANTDAFATKLDSTGERIWNTFLGSAGYDYGQAIAVDGSGNAYVAGYSDTPWGSPQQALAAGTDAFAAKLSGINGQRLWSTFLGGAGNDAGSAIAVDGGGKVYVAGYSNATWGSPQQAFAGGTDAFAVKLDTAGVRSWNTFLGGAGYDYGFAIAVDGSGNAYVAGNSDTTWGSPQQAFAGGSYDAFAAKLDSTGSRGWNTFLGGPRDDEGYGIAVDSRGNVYVAGYSNYTWGSPQRAFAGGYDAFAAMLDSAGVRSWNTFLGGVGNDEGHAIAVVGSGSAYVAGFSDDTWGNPQRAFAGGYDAFAAKLSNIMLNVTVNFGGTVKGNNGGIACGAACSATYAEGAAVKLTAIPSSGYQFTGWGGDCSACAYGNACTLTMNAAKTCTGGFDVLKRRKPIWKRGGLNQ